MEFLYCDGILYINIVQIVYKKIILHFFMLFSVLNLFNWIVRITEEIYKRESQKEFKRIKKRREILKTHV